MAEERGSGRSSRQRMAEGKSPDINVKQTLLVNKLFKTQTYQQQIIKCYTCLNKVVKRRGLFCTMQRKKYIEPKKKKACSVTTNTNNELLFY